ncbi:MAG: single-stranded DNA-binding protein [Spongiibacteraceae bacterium]|nr:single-stranded DNA-binding protein [Spongiibacteraceae bacterium]|tara:strand:+ start:3496 stop:3969 length:474 start_codon:yes stop_codon:yes gene_type:complete
MARSLNLCQFIGNLGQEPEVKYLPSGSAVANFSIAVADDYKDKNTGQKVEQTEWVRCTAFGKLAEIVGEYVKKGSKVYVSGKMKTRKWQAQDGQDRYTTEITVNDLQMLDSRQGGQSAAPQQQSAPPQQPPSQGNAGGGFSDMDDDIPFNKIGAEVF